MGNVIKTILGILVILLIVGATFFIGSSQRQAQERRNQQAAEQQQEEKRQQEQNKNEQSEQTTPPPAAESKEQAQGQTPGGNGEVKAPEAPAAPAAPQAGATQPQPATTPAAGPVDQVVLPLAAIGFGYYLYRRSRKSLATTVRSRS